MKKGVVYVCDSTALIDLHDNFGKRAIKKLAKLAKEKKIVVPEGVCRELTEVTDRLKSFIDKYRKNIEIKLRSKPLILSEFNRINSTYGEKIVVGERSEPGLFSSKRGRRAADAQVLAVAKALSYPLVTDDKKVKLVAMLEDIPHIPWTEFARYLSFTEQLKLI